MHTRRSNRCKPPMSHKIDRLGLGTNPIHRYAARLFLLFFFPCSADHERDWPPCKVVFFGLATNTLNVRNNNNNNNNNIGIVL